MSYRDKYKEEFAEKVRHYSQEEGLKDYEIAEVLGCSRATVNRTRQAFDIPTFNKDVRRDKECSCADCGAKFLIRRNERKKRRCPKCEKNR